MYQNEFQHGVVTSGAAGAGFWICRPPSLWRWSVWRSPCGGTCSSGADRKHTCRHPRSSPPDQTTKEKRGNWRYKPYLYINKLSWYVFMQITIIVKFGTKIIHICLFGVKVYLLASIKNYTKLNYKRLINKF